MTSKKDEIIAKVYYDTAGYGSVANTLADAKKYDWTISLWWCETMEGTNYRNQKLI